MNNLIEAPLALLAGVLTIASPCVLPILPLVLGSAVIRTNRSRPLFIVLGFVLTFAALGMLLASVSQYVAVAQNIVRNIAIAMLGLAGLSMLWRAPYEWAMAGLNARLYSLGIRAGNGGSGNVGGFTLGMSLGAVWTPCAGPVLASILVLVTRAQHLTWSATLLLLYAVGAGIPMIVIAYGGQLVTKRVRYVARHAQLLQKIFGLLIVMTAIAIYFQVDTQFYAWLTNLSSQPKAL